MNLPLDQTPRRVLVIDDNRTIHEDFQKILAPREAGTCTLDAARAALFGEALPTIEHATFELHFAVQGAEGVSCAALALAEGRRYALAFVDVRMPPGIDGVETVAQLWKRDPELQVVLCTAYSDYSWQQTVQKLGHSDRLLVLKKPFDAVEVLQMAHALTQKWALRQALALQMADLEGLVGQRTRELLRANEHLGEQAALLDHARDAIVVRNLDDAILYWNQGAERLYGWTAAEAIGRNSKELLYADREAYREARNCFLAQGDWSGELRQRTKGGAEVIVEGHWTLVRDGAGQPKAVLAINSDVTEKKKLEEQFLRAQRMESIGVLAGGIAHDLNNVLSPIMMALEILRQRFSDPSSTQILQVLENSAERGAGLIKQVLQFARGAAGERILVQPGHVIRDLQNVVGETFPKTIRLKSALAPGVWLVNADPTQMHQVLLNLTVNARDAMPEGGTLTIAAENVTLDETYASMAEDAAAGPYVRLTVTDTGTGMPPETVRRIFDPFFTTKAEGHGTGLGLSTTVNIVKAHGGFIEVESECGTGTTFRVYLPASADAEAAPEDAPAELPSGEGELVLVIDDEPAQRSVTERTLMQFGYRVLTAADGAEACGIFARELRPVAAVVTDLMMPIMDGATTIRALKCMNPALPIIAATGVTAPGRLALAREAGADLILAKPYRTEALLIALRDTLAARVASEAKVEPA